MSRTHPPANSARSSNVESSHFQNGSPSQSSQGGGGGPTIRSFEPSPGANTTTLQQQHNLHHTQPFTDDGLNQPDFLPTTSSQHDSHLSPSQPSFFAHGEDSFGSSLGPPFQYQPSQADPFFGDELSAMGMSPPSPPTTASLGHAGDPTSSGEFFSAPTALPLSNQHLANLASADPNPAARPVMGNRSRSNSQASRGPDLSPSTLSRRQSKPSMSLSINPSGEPFVPHGLPLSPSTTKSLSVMSSLPASPNSLSAAFPTNALLSASSAHSPSTRQGGEWGQSVSQPATASYFSQQSMDDSFYDPLQQQQQQTDGLHHGFSSMSQSQPASPNQISRVSSSMAVNQGTMNPNHASSGASSQQQTPSPTRSVRPRSMTAGSGSYQPSPAGSAPYANSISSATNASASPVVPQPHPFVFGQNLSAGFGSTQSLPLDPSAGYGRSGPSFLEARNPPDFAMEAVPMGRSRSEESEMDGMLSSGHLGDSALSSGEMSRHPGSSGQLTGNGGVNTPDLSSRVKAMTLESRLRDIEGIMAASAKVSEQAAAIRAALIEDRESDLPHGDLAEISNTLKAIASLDGQQVPPQLTLLPSGASSSQLVDPQPSHGHTVTLETIGSVGSGTAGFGTPTTQMSPPASSSSLTVDVAKSLTGKRPAPLSSPIPANEASYSTKHLRRSDEMDESDSDLIGLQPPPMTHSHSFPSTQHQVIPSQALAPAQVHPRSVSSMGLPVSAVGPSVGVTTPVPQSLSIQQQHASIVPSPLAFSTSKASSPSEFGDQQHPQQYLSSLVLPPAQQQGATPAMYSASAGWGQDYELAHHPIQASSSSSALETFQPETILYGSVGPPPSAPPVVAAAPPSLSRRSSNADGRPVVRLRGLTMTSDAEPPSFRSEPSPSSQQPSTSTQLDSGSPEDEIDDMSDESDGEPEVKRRSSTRRRRSSVQADDEDVKPSASVLTDDLRRQLDQIFENFLSTICSDINITDRKGEHIHQTLMPKKMQRLDESWDFRPFKFRIQAFTNAFTERIITAGISDDVMPVKKIKHYLWNQPYISRFNDDGKKAKSKGNHIWNVEAKKTVEGGWIFMRFERKITGTFSTSAYIGVPWTWSPRVWDPHTTAATIKASFSSPPGSLPDWLAWKGNTLSGTAPVNAQSVRVETIATYSEDGIKCQLRQINDLSVTSFAEEQAGMALSRQFPNAAAPPPGAFFTEPSPPLQQFIDPHQQHPGGMIMVPQGPPPGYPGPSQMHFPPVPQVAPNAAAAAAAVVQAVEESGFGRSYQQGHPQLVSESSTITQQVLAVAHSQRQQEFVSKGFVSNEFSNASIENAALRAQSAVMRSADMLGPAASSSEIIRLASHDPSMAAPQIPLQQPQFAQSVDYHHVTDKLGMPANSMAPSAMSSNGMMPQMSSNGF